MKRYMINCDMGEGFGRYALVDEDALFPHIDACNIACGFHAGDPEQIDRSIILALAHGVRIGAHPSYPDLQGFGRRYLQMPEEALFSAIRYQVAALEGMVRSAGGVLGHVKPHGALYNRMAVDAKEARVGIQAIASVVPGLPVMGLANSEMAVQARALGVPFLAEAFADRRYLPNGQLMPRSQAGAVLDKEEAVEQALRLANDGGVKASGDTWLPLKTATVCIHGDSPNAVAIAKAIKTALA